MEKTIYISDLDGTLLNTQKKISDKSSAILNELIQDRHVHFSVATARTPATVEGILEHIHMQEQIIVMNGVALYDLHKHEYQAVEYIGADLVKQITKAVGKWIKQGFIYTIEAHRLTVHYDELKGEGRINFYEERKNLQHKKFIREPLISDDNVIYFVFIDNKENIEQINHLLEPISGIEKVMYQDIYCENSYLLEVYSNRATKANGIKKLKAEGHFDKVVVFGDQLNDKNMFQIANEAYAVKNAVDEIKQYATDIIGTNDEDSVAKAIWHLSKEERKC